MEVVRLLLRDERIDPTGQNCEVVRRAPRLGYEEIVDLLLKDDRVFNSGGRQAAFHGAVNFGNIARVKALLTLDSVDPAEDDNRATQSAAERNDTCMLRLVLQDPRVDPSAKDNNALVRAACLGHESAINLLVSDPRVYINGRIPEVKRMQSQPYLNNSDTATTLIRKAILRMFARCDPLPCDVQDTLTRETLSQPDVQNALKRTHRISLAAAREAKLVFQSLPEDIATEILRMVYGYSIYPWLPAHQRKALLWTLPIRFY